MDLKKWIHELIRRQKQGRCCRQTYKRKVWPENYLTVWARKKKKKIDFSRFIEDMARIKE